jgi:hypothetical protein
LCPRNWGVDIDLANDRPAFGLESRRFLTLEPKEEVVCGPSCMEFTPVAGAGLDVVLASGSTSLVERVVEGIESW